jgi:hypothetical protein
MSDEMITEADCILCRDLDPAQRGLAESYAPGTSRSSIEWPALK